MNSHRPPTEPLWEEVLDRELKNLPDRPAPETLIPRVMAAVQARTCQAWYQRAWWNWPRAAQLLSLVFLAVLLGGLAWLAMHASQGDLASQFGGRVTGWFAWVGPVWAVLSSLANAVGLAVKQVSGWALFGGLMLCGAMYLSCIGLGTMVYRVALNK